MLLVAKTPFVKFYGAELLETLVEFSSNSIKDFIARVAKPKYRVFEIGEGVGGEVFLKKETPGLFHVRRRLSLPRGRNNKHHKTQTRHLKHIKLMKPQDPTRHMPSIELPAQLLSSKLGRSSLTGIDNMHYLISFH